MAHEVKVRQPLPSLDLGIVEQALGEAALDLRSKDHVPAPYITIDGRINATTSFYLQRLRRELEKEVGLRRSRSVGCLSCSTCRPERDVDMSR